MSLSLAAGQAIAGGAAGGASILGNILGYIGQRKANATNLQIAREANQAELALYNLQNAYNSPIEQMKRLEAAGLNPHLVYGSGGVTGNVTKSPQVHKASVINELQNLSNPVMDTLSVFNDLRLKQAQVDNIESVNKLNDQKLINEGFKALSYEYKGLKDKVSYGIAKELEKTQVSVVEETLKNLQQKNRMFEYDILNKQLEYELNRGLKPYGMTTRDNYILRLVMSLVSKDKLDQWLPNPKMFNPTGK